MSVAESVTEVVPIDSVSPMRLNARRGDVEAIERSLRAFGQQIPIVVDPDGQIIKGNHTHAAAVRLGWTHIEVRRSHLSGDSARAFALADNNTTDRSRQDPGELAEMLSELAESDRSLLEATSYTFDDIDALHAIVADTDRARESNGGASPTRPPAPDPCPACGFDPNYPDDSDIPL